MIHIRSNTFLSRRVKGGGFDSDYQAVLDYAIAEGDTLPSTAQQELGNALMLAAKSSGVFGKAETMLVSATDGDSGFASICWKRREKYTLVNSPAYISNQGFFSDGVSAYLNSNFNTQSGSLYKQNDASEIIGVVNMPTGNVINSRLTGNVSLGNLKSIRLDGVNTNRNWFNSLSFQSFDVNQKKDGLVWATTRDSSTTGKFYEYDTTSDSLTVNSNLTTSSDLPYNDDASIFWDFGATAESGVSVGLHILASNITQVEFEAFMTAYTTYITSI